jgi:L-lactate dehydrogenase complex protein LldG
MDTSAARRNIFARIRSAQGRTLTPTDAERAAARDYLARHPSGPRPELPSTDAERVARFALEAGRLSTTVAEVDAVHVIIVRGA